MIDWFNNNQGFVLSVLTAVYVVATLVILLVMAKSNRLAAKSIEHANPVHDEQTRPYVIFDLVVRDRSNYAELQNYGATPAINVRVSLSPTQQFPALKKRRGFRGRLQEAFVTREPRLVFTHEDNPGIITNS